jgi:hypothetical protein
MMIHRALHASSAALATLKLPRIPPLIMDQPRIVVAFVEVFEDGGEDLGFFVWEGDSLACCFEELASAGCLEEWRVAELVFVGGEQSLFSADDEGYD